MDKLRAMTFFCRTVEAKSFAAAAQALGMVPSALSKAIAALEHELGFALLNRSTRGLALTDEGGRYYEQCRQILSDIEDAEGTGRRGGTQARGTLRVGMHPGLRYAVMTTLRPFLGEHPDLRIETLITNTAAAVVDEGLDLVLCIGALADSSMIARPLGWTRPIVCATPDYFTSHGEPHHPSELAQHSSVIYARRDEAPNTRWRFAKGGETCEVDVPVRAVSRDGIGLVDAALSGCGVARPLEIAARHWVVAGRLREVLNDWTGEPQAIAAVSPPQSRTAPAKVRLYIEYLASMLAA
ncbi:MAG: LysR family transcriptional regulator [Burkholderiaceae bacterium]|nr:LysR family transcriptional regulator [Burkholderiaceae bacterium]